MMEEIANKCRDMVIWNNEGKLVFEDEALEEKDMGEEEALNRSPRAKEDEEVDEGLMIRPPPEPPPRMMLAARICSLCLNLLRLLVQNRIAEFHTELELLSPNALEDPCIKHAVELEQSMEGA
ncbi:unnamed protein product [Cuscuta epithymum]|uniref:CSN8/PSMD8/EIF3K domain-containing protein n=1 Tax=Cuscuta epithymum TaxID=186058 RepID=A0AAV0G1B5_9ASTE|nr:unnamed protein product [Cuscuta epithymum]